MQNDSGFQNAKRYSRIRHNLALFEIAFTLVFLLLFQASGLSLKFKSFSLFFTKNQPLIIAIYIILLGLFFDILTFWLDYFGGYKLEHKFKLSRQNFFSWLKDYFKKMLIGGVLYLIVVETFYFFLKNSPRTWWIWTSIFWLFFSLFLAKIFPVFIIPLFYKLENLDDERLKNNLLTLAKKAHIKVVDIYKIGLGAKTKKANAALAGVGSSKRILLSDTLLSDYSSEEIEATLAHELAHHKYLHFWKLIILNLITTALAFLTVFFSYNFFIYNIIKLPIYDISIFPVLSFIFMCFGVIVTPIQNAISRYFESQADKEAIKLTGKPEAFISLMEKLTKQNLQDPEPSKIVEAFFYDHPPAIKRIQQAKIKK